MVSDPKTPNEVRALVDLLVQAVSPGEPARVLAARDDEATQRLGLLSLVLGGAAFLAVAINVLLGTVFGLETEAVMVERMLCHTGVLLLSLSVYALTRTGLPSTLVLNIGLTYEVVGAWGVTLPNLFDQGFTHDHVGRITWLCIWITLFPILAPSSPGKKLLAATLAAAAAPGLLWVSWLSGNPAPSVQAASSVILPPLVCAGLALATSHFMRRLEARLSRAEAAAERLGSYRLLELLGKGGMGEVWRAEHALLARPAAVKIIRADYFGPDPESRERALTRFKQEAESLAALSDPHTVSIYDYGISLSGRPYYVMELLHGLDLETLVERFGPVSEARMLNILIQACSSLAEAHQAGLVHRDVKPANICVCRVGLQHDYVKLLDFGLVARLSSEIQRSLKLTGAGFTVGSPAFMAPEAIRALAPDPRSDIYSLACTGYWLLTGKFVFDAESAVEVMAEHLHKEPPPLAHFGRAVHPQLEALLRRCLAKSPADRPQSMTSLAGELQACRELLESTWTPEDADRWWAEHPDSEGHVGAASGDPARRATISWDLEAREHVPLEETAAHDR